jgi:hypothetical protein
MYCPKCGAQNEPQVPHCAFCGQPMQGAQSAPPGSPPPYQTPTGLPPKPFNWLIPAIISLVVCGCLPLSVVSIVFAAQVDSKYAMGDYDGAETSAGKAKLFFFLSIVFGVLCSIAGVVAWILLGAASIAAGN